MAGFNLTAQLQLQAPTNTNQVVSSIKKQLSGITVDVQVKGDPRNLAQVNKQMQNVSRSASASSKSVSNLNRNLSEAARRFSVITVATGTMLALARSIKNAVGEAIAFERELVKISQVTGKSVSQLSGLTDEITRLSTSLGASSSDLLNVSRTLAQAGFEAGKTKQALDILAKTSLGATFDSIQDTTEGAIAVLRQFRKEARQAGGDIKFLEQTMDAINSVSKSFAVESGDLITVIRRVGGVFESAGGSVNELISLFTSVRATTRESAETIATGLRTIFTRIQRTDTVDQLAALGIQLRDAQGQFVGAYEGVRRLSQGLSSLDPRDFRFSEIVESLGGFRQVGKVIPLIRQFTVAQDALNVAQSASGSVARDAATAQQSLQVQAAKVTEDFRALMRTLADSSTFRSIAKGALEMASAFIRIAEALEPLLPLITSLIGLRIGKALAPGIGALVGVGGARRKSGGGKIHKFASGGFVPGTGSRDTVPAMLQPGEFVIKKSSASKLGSGTLEAMNNNRYATGGLVVNRTNDSQFAGLFAKPKGPDSSGKLISLPPRQGREGSDVLATIGAPKSFFIGGTDEQAFNAKAQNMLETGINQLVSEIAPSSGNKASGTILSDIGSADIAGKIFEGVSRTIIGDFRAGGGSQQGFDIPRGGSKTVLGELGNLFNSGNPMSDIDYDNKLTESLSNRQSLLKKAINDNLMSSPINIATFSGGSRSLGTNELIKQRATKDNKGAARLRISELNAARERVRQQGLDEETETIVVKRLNADIKKLKTYTETRTIGTKRQNKNAGGKIDSVPALLTPGEFVVKKSSAESIGYSNLSRMNQTGVQKFATGGAVQRFTNGGGVQPSSGNQLGQSVQYAMSELDPKSAAMLNAAMKSNTSEFNELAAKLSSVEPDQAEAALKAFSRGAIKGEKGLVAIGEKAAGVVSTVDELKSEVQNTIGKTGEQRQGDKDRLANVSGATRTTAEERAAAKEPASNIQSQGPTVQRAKAKGRVQASAQMGIALGVDPNKPDSDASNDLKKNMKRYTSLIDSGATHQEALNQVMGDLDKTEKSRLQKLKQSKAGKLVGALGGGAKKGGRRVAETAQSMQGLAGTAQNFALIGGAALAASIQMSSLSDVTKQAATETIGFAATLASGGAMAVDVLANLANIGKAAAVANTVEATSSGGAAAADTAEAGASMLAAGPILLMAAAVAGVVLALKYFASQSKAQADNIAKNRKESLDKLASGEGGSAAASQASGGVAIELGLRDSADQFNMAAYGAAAAGTATALGFAAAGATAGAAFGSVIPVVGTLIGALVGAGIGYAMLANTNTEEMEARKKQIESIKGSITAIQEMGESGKKFDDAMGDLDKIKLPNTEAGKTQRVQQELAITANLDTGPTEQEFNKLAELAAKVNKPIAALSEADFEDMPEALVAFQTASMATGKSMELLAKKTSAARATLQKAAELEITGELGFDELMASGGLLSKAFDASQDAIKAEANGKIAAAKAQQEAAKKTLRSADTTETERDAASASLNSAVKEENDARNRATGQLKAEEDALRMTTQAAQERFRADKLAAAAAEALRVQLLQTTNFLKGLNEIEANQQEQAASLSNRSALISGGDMDFTRTGPRGLDGDITMIKDLQAFTNEMMVAIGDLPPALRGEAKKQLGIVTDASRVFNEGKNNVLKNFKTGPAEGDPFGPEQQLEIIKKAGLDPENLNPDILANMLEQIAKKGLDGIDAAEFDEIFDPVKEAAAPAQEALQKMNQLRNNEIANLSSYLDNVKAKRDAELALLQNVLKANDTARDLVAQARGTQVSARDKEISRRASAQADLAGTGIRAGDAAGAARTLRSANLQRQAIEKEIQNRKASGASILRLVEKDKRLQETAAKASKELERLATQSERASDMISQIEEERSKREVLTGLVTDFVVGGRDERQGMVQAMAGIQNAVATGTLQNQTPEQRSATVGMLDRLENIILPGMGGLTGKQVKQELVFRDAIKMGLDPEIAKELATATSKEEQLIKAVEQLTEQMKFAARMQAAAALASGGLVQYRAGGGSIFQPKGTDTVPAMLTPGEFVIRKSAVDRIGAGNLAALNKGGSVQYRQAGGAINALNAGAGGAVNFPSGDAIKALFGDAVRANPGNFLRLLKKSGVGGEDFEKISQKIQFLARNNRLNANNFSFSDGLAATYDRFIGSSSIFSRADANNVSLKKMPGHFLSGASLTVGRAEGLIPSITDYVNKLGMVALGGEKPKNQLASDVIQDYTGINLRERAKFLSNESKKRAKGLFNVPNILARRIKAEKSRGEENKDGNLGQNSLNIGGSRGFIGFPTLDGDVAKGGSLKLEGFADEKARRGDRRQQSFEEAIRFLQKAGILRMATGGGVPGTDTVPAMLTPGEFVMSKSAVAQHGVGYMKSLNRGHIPGFNRGGVVGRGNVQYKHDGGSISGGNAVLSIDPTPLQNVLSAFNTNFSLTLDKITGPLQGMTSALTDIATAFQRMQMSHEFKGDISMSVNISNKDAIISAVTKGITPSMEQLIINVVDREFDDRLNNP